LVVWDDDNGETERIRGVESRYHAFMPLFEDPNARVAEITFHETMQAEIRFADGREVVWSGALANELREAVQAAVMRGFARKRRGSSGPNSIAN
jgi:hypothetical protein